MPLAWIPVWLGVLLGSAQGQAPATVHEVFAGNLDVTAARLKIDPDSGTYTFSEGVVAKYDVETIHADLLVVRMSEMKATASGHVFLDDPDAKLTADRLEFDWRPGEQHGTAENFVMQVANVTMRAKRAELTPQKYELFDVSGTSCRRDPPFFELKTRHLTIYPEVYGKAERPSLSLLGHNLLSIPDRTFNLNPRTEGFNIPTVSYRKGAGLGVNFSSGFLLSPQTDLSVGYGAYPGVLPGYGATLTHTFLPVAKVSHIVTPRSELSERFTYGYLDDILVTKPEDEVSFLRRTRSTVALESLWNQSTEARGDPAHYSKPLEGVFETGGVAGGLGYYGQARLQSIRRNSEAIHGRLALLGAAGPAPKAITPNLSTTMRLDSTVFVGPNYGWVRGTAGLIYRSGTQVTLAFGGYASQDFGHSQFDIDQLISRDGLVFRGDFHFGPTKFSYMTKWDHSLGMFDREYSASQVVGCLEPFVVYRKNPNTYNIGIRFRLDDFYDMLRRRDFRRGASTTQTISPTPQGKP